MENLVLVWQAPFCNSKDLEILFLCGRLHFFIYFFFSSKDVENLVLVWQAPFFCNSKDVEDLVLVWQAPFFCYSKDVENLVLVWQAPFFCNSKEVENLVLVWQSPFCNSKDVETLFLCGRLNFFLFIYLFIYNALVQKMWKTWFLYVRLPFL